MHWLPADWLGPQPDYLDDEPLDIADEAEIPGYINAPRGQDHVMRRLPVPVSMADLVPPVLPEPPGQEGPEGPAGPGPAAGPEGPHA